MLQLGTELKLQAASTFDPWEQGLSPAATGRLIYRSEGIWVHGDNQSLSSQQACPHFIRSLLHSPLLQQIPTGTAFHWISQTPSQSTGLLPLMWATAHQGGTQER